MSAGIDWGSHQPGGSASTFRDGAWEVRVTNDGGERPFVVALQLSQMTDYRAVAVGMTTDQAAELGFWLLSAARSASRLNR